MYLQGLHPAIPQSTWINAMHQRYHLTHTDAQKIVSAIQAKLEDGGRGAAIAVTDAQGELIAFLRTDGCKLPSILIAINKAYTAAREQRESYAIGESSRSQGFPMTNFGDLRYTAWGGGVPIFYHEQVVGAVGVSGLPEAEDMELARMGAKLIGEG
jgi:glc operon protein GlcG